MHSAFSILHFGHLPAKLKFDYGRNVTERVREVTKTAAPGTYCHRALRGKLKFDYGRNVTERVREVTKTAAPGTYCHRALRGKLKFGIMVP